VSAQVALSLLLLVGPELFVSTLRNLKNLDRVFQREGVLLVDLDGQRKAIGTRRLTAFYSDLLDRVQHVPGWRPPVFPVHTPLSGWTWTEAVAPKGQPVPEQDNAVFIAAGPKFFATMQTPLLGRPDFDARDRGDPQRGDCQSGLRGPLPCAGRNPVGEYVTATV